MNDTTDSAAIRHLKESFALQRAAYLKAPCPTMAERLEWLSAIPAMLMGNAKRIADALNSDYGQHSELTAYMFDVVKFGGAGTICGQYASHMDGT